MHGRDNIIFHVRLNTLNICIFVSHHIIFKSNRKKNCRTVQSLISFVCFQFSRLQAIANIILNKKRQMTLQKDTCKLCVLFVALQLLLGSTTTTARAFSQLHYDNNNAAVTASSRATRRRILSTKSAASSSRFMQEQLSIIRGGEQQQQEAETSLVQEQDVDMSQPQQQQSQPQYASLNPLTLLAPLGTSYKAALEATPIFTKSVTACLIFGLSDYLAQVIENKSHSSSSNNNNNSKSDAKDGKNKKTARSTTSIVWKRTLMSAAVGFFYFGPAAHAWYDWIFRLLPGTSLVSTLQKAALGQVLFGPSFTCIFFASSLLQSGQFSIMNWWNKIRQDLFGAWLAGIGFWPLVDVISYSIVPLVYIPLFINMCSLVWTIYLSKISNRPTTNTNTDQATTASSS
jgi:protein Mpv17